MSKKLQKHTNIDVIAFLEEKMRQNTEHYQTDFDLDKKIFARAVESDRKDDKTVLWMSRPMGTHCNPEYEAFIRGTYAHNTWRFYAEQTRDDIVACAVEVTGISNGVIRGNVYELDYQELARDIAAKSVQALEVEKTFQDGFVDRVSLEKGSYPYYVPLVEKHGDIVKSVTIPMDKIEHSYVLLEQKNKRAKMKEAAKHPGIDAQIANAENKKTAAGKTEQSQELENQR